MAFENTAGPKGKQALALFVASDYSAFINCRMDGYQDTLCTHSQRQFYRGCTIKGTVDFIYGPSGAALIQYSKIVVKKPEDGQENMITADGREKLSEPTGIVLQRCDIVAQKGLEKRKLHIKSYLVRPWKPYSRTMIMESKIGHFIHPEGWKQWDNNHTNHQTCEYREYANTGPGADTSRRVKWPSFAVVTDRRVAEQYTAGPFLEGPQWQNKTIKQWLKNTGARVSFGLTH